MEHEAGRLRLSLAVSYLLCILCTAPFFGCANPNIVPAGKIARGNVTLSWNNAPGVVSYNIYFAGRAGMTKWNSSKIPNAANPITVSDLIPGKTYYFAITGVSESGESEILVEKSYTAADHGGFLDFGDLAPEARNLRGRATGEQAPRAPVTLAWDNVPNAVAYNIYWSESPGVTKQNGKKIANVTNPYTFKGLKQGQTYYVVVTAVGQSGESKESDELSFSVK
jgi:fibronectin type 3 domain-containing protein